MSTKRQAKPVLNPLAVMAAHQKVGQADTDMIALPVLVHLDMAKRGQADANCANFLTKHILIALSLGSKCGNRAFYDLAGKAWDQLAKAAARPDELLRLTTGEYQALRRMISAYLRIMPTVSVGALNVACANADKILNDMVKEAA